MTTTDKTILVFGATGQQGGSVARELLSRGWPVRAFVRDPRSPKAQELSTLGAELVIGDFLDRASVERAMVGCYGVFSVQPSSGQGAIYDVSDADEIAYGSLVAEAAVAANVVHLVYSSANAAGPQATGAGHFDTKSEIERRVRNLDIRHTIVRPSALMEILMLPGMGLDQGRMTFFMRPDQSGQFLAVEDIGKIVAGVFAEPDLYAGKTFEIASDAVTGTELAEKLSRAAGRPIAYHRFPEELLQDNGLLGTLAGLVDDGRLAGNADLADLRLRFQGLLTFDQWLEGTGGILLREAMDADGGDIVLR